MHGLTGRQWDEARDFIANNAKLVCECRSFSDLCLLMRKTESRETGERVSKLRRRRDWVQRGDTQDYEYVTASDKDMLAAREGLTALARGVGAAWAKKEMAGV